MLIRIAFSKTEAMRYTGHLDLHRTWERTLRRTGLGLAYTQGFKPHPRINLGCALPLGFTSEAELVDIHLETEMAVDTVAEMLARAAPPGIEIHKVEVLPPGSATLQSQIQAAEYVLTLLEPIENLEERIKSLLEANELPRHRQGKAYDLRPLIHELRELDRPRKSAQRVFVRLSAREGATGRPEEVILALGGKPEATRAHRTRLVFNPN